MGIHMVFQVLWKSKLPVAEVVLKLFVSGHVIYKTVLVGKVFYSFRTHMEFFLLFYVQVYSFSKVFVKNNKIINRYK